MRVVSYYTGARYTHLALRWKDRAAASGVQVEGRQYEDRGDWRSNVWARSLAFAQDYLKNPVETLRLDVDCKVLGSLDELAGGDKLLVRVFETPETTGLRELGGTLYLPSGYEGFARCLYRVCDLALRGASPFSSCSSEQDLLSYAIGDSGVEWGRLPSEYCWIPVHDGDPSPRTKIVHDLASKGAYGVDRTQPKRRNVHVMMPCWGDGAHMDEVLRSLEGQRFRDFSLTVHYDGPPYGGILVVGDFIDDNPDIPVRVQFSPMNRGTANALNRAADFGLGSQYTTWMANDDIRHPDWLSKMVAFMDARPTLQSCFSSYMRDTGAMVDGRWQSKRVELYRKPYKHGDIFANSHCIAGPSFLWRTEAMRACLPHRGRISHDYDYWLKMEEHGPVGWLDEPLVTYRVHDQRTTVLKKHEYDGVHWREEARRRRG